jgi:DNA replication protein DnaC
MTGPTGSGKTWIACALAHQACRQGWPAKYWRVLRLFQELRTSHGDGSYLKLLKRLAKTPVLVLDDWGLIALSTQDRADLLEVLDDRINARSTVICSQLPVDTWHAYLGEPTLADAILDRIVQATGLPVLTVEPRREALSRLGLNIGDLPQTVATAVGGGNLHPVVGARRT